MARVQPFRAIRPKKDKANRIISESFENYSETELSKILSTNPDSFLQIITSGSRGSDQTKANSFKKRFEHIKNKYLDFKQNKRYVRDDNACFYIYRITNHQGTFTGIIAKTSTEEYGENTIKKHEEIISSRKKNFANYLKHVGFNADPVLLTYPDTPAIDKAIRTVLETTPAYDFIDDNQTHHNLWVLNDPDVIASFEEAFKLIPELYIADGHHRCASSYALAQMTAKNKDKKTDAAHQYFMSYLLPESQLKIDVFQRLIKDLNGLNKEQLLIAIADLYEIENFGDSNQVPLHTPFQFSMYLEETYYRLTLKESKYQFTDVLSKLAPQLLNQTILQPILGITDVRKDSRIQCIYADNGMIEIKKKVDQGVYKIGFSMQAVTVDELKAIADANLKMPPKSTYVLPKLPSGFLLYEF